MGDYVEEFVAFLGWEVDASELKEFKKQVDGVGDMLKTASKVIIGAAGALATLTAIVNTTTAANMALAKSVGVSSEFLESMGGVVRPLGFEMENVVDLVEEMNNKIGESIGMGVPISGVADATKILGLEFKSLKDLAPEDQFIAILDAAKNLENQQAAVSAVDILMGGEANKILGFLRAQDEGLLELIERQMKLNLLTDQGRKGAERFNTVFGEFSMIANTAKAEFFGLLGDVLAPLLEKYSDWVVANNELIGSKISEWANTLGRSVSWVITQFTWFIGKIGNVVERLGGLENTLKLVGITMLAVFGAKTVMMINTFIKLMRAAGTEALLMNIKAALIPATIAAIIVLFALIGEDLYQFFTGGESALGKIGEKISNFLHTNVKPAVADFLGMTPEELDMAMVKAVDAIVEFFTVTIPDIIIGFIDWITEVFFPFVVSIYDFIVNVFSYIIQFFMGWFNLVVSIFSNVGTFIGESIAKIVLFFMDFKQNMLDIGIAIADFFIGIVNKFVAMIKSLPAKLISFVKDSVSGISDMIKDIPFVGDLVQTLATGGSASGAVSMPRASGGALAAGASIRNSSSSITDASKSNNTFNITQNAGENGQDFATRVASEVHKMAAGAVKANKSGIEN